MAVEAVTSSTTPQPSTITTVPPGNGRIAISEETLKKMTASEIIEGYNNQNWAVPQEILDWANQEVQNNPNSKITYGESSGGNVDGEQDIVSYGDILDDIGVGKKAKCRILTKLSEKMEQEDMINIAIISPFALEQPEDETDGNGEESAVSQALAAIASDMKQGFFSGGFGNNSFQEGAKFFDAFNAGIKYSNEGVSKKPLLPNKDYFFAKAIEAKEELYQIDDSLESMQAILDDTSHHAKQSVATGTETLEAGRALKSSAKWWHFGRKHVARKAIDQGKETTIMGKNTLLLSEAIKKDNGLVKQSVEENIETVIKLENSVVTDGEGGGSTGGEGGSTGGEGGSTGGEGGGSTGGGGSTPTA